MDPKKFAALERRVLDVIPSKGSKPIAEVIESFGKDGTGYGRSDAKAAILGLKADGKVTLDQSGNVSRTASGAR
ncbi:MAG: hypothetical protein IPI67_26890 [Myxococcales bacterium]|nr:hypothetical protein [Myxococcales bacterium]